MYENEEESFILWSSWYAWLHKSYLIHDDDREAIMYDWFNTHIKKSPIWYRDKMILSQISICYDAIALL